MYRCETSETEKVCFENNRIKTSVKYNDPAMPVHSIAKSTGDRKIVYSKLH